MKKNLVTALVGLSALLVAPQAFAEEITVDFTGDGNGQDRVDEWVVDEGTDGVTVTVTPEPDGSVLYWDATDGFGVRGPGYEADEVEGSELLVISFSQPVEVTEVALTDLFREYSWAAGGYLETGSIELSDGTVIPITADPSQTSSPSTNGELTVAVNAVTRSITFSAPGRVDGENHEFSVAGVSFEKVAVPELDPSSATGGLAFLTSFLLVATGRRRKRGRK